MTVYITIGIPASGKSTFARQFVRDNPDSVIVCRDDIRNSHGLNSGENEKFVTRLHRAQMEAAFLEGFDVVVADTNINQTFRKRLIKFCHEHGQDVMLVPFPISVDEAIMRDSKREQHKVGVGVINRFYKDYQSQNLADEPELLPAPVFDKAPQYDPHKQNAITVDIDGTVARHVTRNVYDESRVSEDEPIEDVIAVIRALIESFEIVFVSGRHNTCYEDTADWIMKYMSIDVRNTALSGACLMMRGAKDNRPDYIIKSEIYDNRIFPHFNVIMALDDRDQVVRYIRTKGVTVAQVAEGRF